MSDKALSEAIKKDLEPLIAEARHSGLWLHCRYKDIWISPDELQAENEKGSLLWGSPNWQLRNPADRVDYLQSRVRMAEKDLDDFLRRLGKQ